MAGAGTLDILGRKRRSSGIGRQMVQDILREAMGPRPKDSTTSLLGRDVDLNQITPEQAASLTSELEGAQTDTGFSGAQEAFDLIDIPGALVRGVVGAGLSLAKGDVDKAGERLLSALPGSENIPKLFGSKGIRAPEGSELLADVGFEPGTTADDERRVRIAMAAGIGRGEALKKFATRTGKPLAFEQQQEFDKLLQRVEATNPGLDTGVTFEDAKKAADLQDAAGIAVEIALDPLTYLTFGASAAGKAARGVAQLEKLGAKILPALKEVSTFDDAARIVRGIDIAGFGPKAKSKLLEDMAAAFKGGKPDLDFGRSLAERSQKGQLSAGFKIPFGPEFGPKLPTQGIANVLSTIGQPALLREAGNLPYGVNQGVHDFLTETPVIGQITKALRGAMDAGRRVTGKTGVAGFDDAIKEGLGIARTGVAEEERALTKLEARIRDLSRGTGVAADTIKRTALDAAETIKARAKTGGYATGSAVAEKMAADYAATLSRTGLKESDIAPLAAGFAEINERLAAKAHKFKLPLNELSDESLSYMHRMITGPGLDWVKANKGKFKDVSGGLEFNARSGMFEGRIEKWQGKTIGQINEAMSEALGGGKFFTDDPVAATRHAVHEMHRRVGNAYTAAKIVERFGAEPAEAVVKNSALDLYEKLGLKVADSEMDALSKTAVPREIFEAMTRVADFQKAPGKFVKAWRKIADTLKATVTVLFPAFHGRNMLENGFKSVVEGNANPENFQAAMKLLAKAQDLNAGGGGFLADAARNARGVIQKAAGDVDPATMKLLSEEAGFKTVDEFAAWANGNGLLENRFTSEFGVDMRNALKGTPATGGEKAQQAFGGVFGLPLKTGFAVASGTENWFRLSMFIDRLKKGFGREGALSEVKRVFFDYRDLGARESQLAKDFGFFYTFYRQNARYIAQTAAKHPIYTKQISRLFGDDPDNPRWSWMSDKAAFKVGGYDVSLGFLPQQQFNMFDLSEGDVFDKMQGKLGDAIGQANPVIEGALSAAFGKDLYKNQPLEYVDKAADWTFAPEWMQRMIGLRQTTGGGYVMSPKWRWAMDSIPALGRFAQTQISLDKQDRQLWQTLAQVLAGVRIEKGDIAKDSMALLDRNIKRAGKGLPELREDGPNAWRVDRRTVEGRYISALTKAQPDKADVIALAANPEYIGRLAPYITLDKDGEPVMNRLLVDRMHTLGMEKYPRHWALLRAQQARDASRIKTANPFETQAQAAFAGLFGGR
jgi:hypothetical protein